MVERARGLSGVLRERQRSLTQALDAAADADVVSTLEAEGARLTGELEATEAAAADLTPEQDALTRAEREIAAELQAHLDAWGDGGRLRQAEEAATVARGQLDSLERALERDRQALGQLSERLVIAERRVAVFEHEDHELGERLAHTEQARHGLQAGVAGTEAAHTLAIGRLEAAEEVLRQAEQEFHRAVARADALEKAFDEARGAAGAELLAGVDGVVGTLLDLVKVDEGWEDAFEAAAGASVAAVVVSGNEPARAALSRLRQGGATGRSSLSPTVPARAVPRGTSRRPPEASGSVIMCGHVQAAVTHDSLRLVLDTLLSQSCCVRRGWSEAIDLALARPDLVVVTRDGDRFSSSGWRVRATGGVVTAAVVDEARSRVEMAALATSHAAEERAAARSALETTRVGVLEAVRADDRNEIAHQTARVARQRVADDRVALAAELDEAHRTRAELDERIARDGALAAELGEGLPDLEEARAQAADQAAAAREERTRLDERITEAAVSPQRVGDPLGLPHRTPAGPERATPGGRSPVDRACR